MHSRSSIVLISDIIADREYPIPSTAGVYAFWWAGDRKALLASNRTLLLSGPKKVRIQVHYGEWWPAELPFPCLYVGKSTNLKKRFGQHLKLRSPGRLHKAHVSHHKAKPHTTSCQLRWGIEHIFPGVCNPLGIIKNSVGFSFSKDKPENAGNAFAERFFEEDRLVGLWRPWFNIDSER